VIKWDESNHEKTEGRKLYLMPILTWDSPERGEIVHVGLVLTDSASRSDDLTRVALLWFYEVIERDEESESSAVKGVWDYALKCEKSQN